MHVYLLKLVMNKNINVSLFIEQINKLFIKLYMFKKACQIFVLSYHLQIPSTKPLNDQV